MAEAQASRRDHALTDAQFTDHRDTATIRARVLERAPLDLFHGDDGAEGIRDLLREAAETLDMSLILVGHVNNSRYTTVAFYSKDADPSIKRGDTIPIGETYCREEIVSGDSFVLEDATLDPEFAGHPGHVVHGLRAYVGASLRLGEDTVFGTLCGVDGRARTIAPEAAEELAGLAQSLSDEIARRLAEREGRPGTAPG